MDKKMVEEAVRETFKDSILQTKRVDESFAIAAVVVAGAAAAGATAAVLKDIDKGIERAKRETAIAVFWEEVDKAGRFDRQLKDITQRFKLVKTLEDVDRMRREVEKLKSTVSSWENKVKTFDVEAAMAETKLSGVAALRSGRYDKKVDKEAAKRDIRVSLTQLIRNLDMAVDRAAEEAEAAVFAKS